MILNGFLVRLEIYPLYICSVENGNPLILWFYIIAPKSDISTYDPVYKVYIDKIEFNLIVWVPSGSLIAILYGSTVLSARNDRFSSIFGP